MKRPAVLLIASLAAGIVAADIVFYWASVAVPPWLGACLWGLAVLLALLALVSHRWQQGRSIFVARPMFIVLVVLFMATLGFARYAAYAEQVQVAWRAMAHPPVNRGRSEERRVGKEC